ncbi:hypothetical protein BC941DRAFT_474439 [Chlamydoabsidia padenii]|nr:hypothetical protein BC941DRAFT_474439 [Chlamydoabsidia padenii]
MSTVKLTLRKDPEFYHDYEGDIICILEGSVCASISLNSNFHKCMETSYQTYVLPIRLKDPSLVHFAHKYCRKNWTFILKGHLWIDKDNLYSSLLMECLLIGNPQCFDHYGDMLNDWSSVGDFSLGVARFDMPFQNVFTRKSNDEKLKHRILETAHLNPSKDFKMQYKNKLDAPPTEEEQMVYDHTDLYFKSNGNMDTFKSLCQLEAAEQNNSDGTIVEN